MFKGEFGRFAYDHQGTRAGFIYKSAGYKFQYGVDLDGLRTPSSSSQRIILDVLLAPTHKEILLQLRPGLVWFDILDHGEITIYGGIVHRQIEIAGGKLRFVFQYLSQHHKWDKIYSGPFSSGQKLVPIKNLVVTYGI